ncbi:MAG TPA: sigma-54 dependent transcriptional regulator [Nitrospirota bacterium]
MSNQSFDMSEPVIVPPASKPGKKVLIVDDEFLIRYSLQNLIEREGFSVITADSGLHALQQFEQEKPEIVILDIRLPDSNGLVLLKTMKEINPSVTVVMVTACPDIQSSVEAIKMGAFDYLDKPIDFEKLIGIMNTLKEERSQDQMGRAEDNLIFTSNAMKEVYRVTERLANKSDVTLLVLGESGTGKSFLCKTIHELSARKGRPFVEIGCSTIPDHLIESELFGYEKGAFTDAKGSKKGLIEVAEGGTVFLDEIGDMPYAMQSKVLGLIEERKFRRVGGLQQINADVRILAATNKNLHDLVHEGKFRLDLYYRLNVVTIEMPPLRKRPEDVPLLVDYYLKHFCTKYVCQAASMTKPAVEILQKYSWPGNVRELRNLVEKLVIMAKSAKIDVDDLPPNVFTSEQASAVLITPMDAAAGHAPNGEFVLPEDGISLDEVEKDLIRQALDRSNHNKAQAAKLLKISYDTLRYQVKKYGLE